MENRYVPFSLDIKTSHTILVSAIKTADTNTISDIAQLRSERRLSQRYVKVLQ